MMTNQLPLSLEWVSNMQFDIVGGSYENKYISVNAQKTINWYIHKQILKGAEEKYGSSLQPFPGLVEFCDTSISNLRKHFVARTVNYTRYFIVADNVLYEADVDGNLTNRGTMTDMSTDANPVYMAVNGNEQLLIVEASASYWLDLATNVLTKVTDADFPSNPTYMSYGQGYFFVTAGGRVYYSDLNSAANWTGSSVFTPTAQADKTLAAVFWRDDVHCFSNETIEIYINDGSTPFVKQDRSTINVGIFSVDTISVFHEGIIFVGQSRNGQKKVYYYNGQTVAPISDSNIDWAINNPTALSGTMSVAWEELNDLTWDQWYDQWGITENDAYSEIQYSKDGHIFYYLTIQPLNTTYVFDMTSQEWVERQSLLTDTSLQKQFRGKSLVNFNGMNLWTDTQSGKILKEDFETLTEDGNAITRTRISKFFSNEKKNISVYSFELDCTTGVGLSSTPATAANLSFYYSRNGGNSYSNAITLSTGASGSYIQRPRTHKLGTARDWVFKLVQTDTADLAINSAIVNGIVDKY
jgi:hypothetical protein